MKKMMMTLAAVLCCAMSTMMFTSCGSDDEPVKEPAEDKTPAKVAMKFAFYQTEDMLNYCNVVITYDDGTGKKSVTLTKDNVNAQLSWEKTVASDRLPAVITFSRKVTLKQSIDELERFSFTRGYYYMYEFYNAANKDLGLGALSNNSSSQSGNGAKVAEYINQGKLDHTYTFTFNKKGEMDIDIDSK